MAMPRQRATHEFHPGAAPPSRPPEAGTCPAWHTAAGEAVLGDLLAWLEDGDLVTLTFTAGALRQALSMAAGGPEVMSTTQAARIYGWTSKRWRGWAEAGRVEGAWQDERGRWRLPRTSCRALAAGRARASAPPPHQGVPTPVAVTASQPGRPSIRRGPRGAQGS